MWWYVACERRICECYWPNVQITTMWWYHVTRHLRDKNWLTSYFNMLLISEMWFLNSNRTSHQPLPLSDLTSDNDGAKYKKSWIWTVTKRQKKTSRQDRAGDWPVLQSICGGLPPDVQTCQEEITEIVAQDDGRGAGVPGQCDTQKYIFCCKLHNELNKHYSSQTSIQWHYVTPPISFSNDISIIDI